MLERILYPSDRLPQIYDVTCFDDSGEEIGKDGVLRPLSREVDREVQFREHAEQRGATSYSVHLMTHQEVRHKLREVNGSLFDQYVRFVTESLGLEEALRAFPLIMTDSKQAINPTT